MFGVEYYHGGPMNWAVVGPGDFEGNYRIVALVETREIATALANFLSGELHNDPSSP